MKLVSRHTQLITTVAVKYNQRTGLAIAAKLPRLLADYHRITVIYFEQYSIHSRFTAINFGLQR